MILTLVVPDPPPTRERPGRSADRDSPNAGPLVSAAQALLGAGVAPFPVVFTDIRVVFGKTMPDVDPLGYQPDHPIYEVLQDVGVVIEPEGWSSRNQQDPSADFYVVTFVLEDREPVV
jgi:hypothetical protein